MIKPLITIRSSRPGDLAEVQRMFAETVSTVCKDDYSEEQILAWVSSIENTRRWMEKLTSQYFLIADYENRIVGFASLEDHDCIDLLYVHKDFQRQGIADRLYSDIEKEAIKRGVNLLTSVVSITARPFFQKKGFETVKKQTNVIHGVEFTNFKMMKSS